MDFYGRKFRNLKKVVSKKRDGFRLLKVAFGKEKKYGSE